jgi:tetrahydromethanopterin S-methyltransferase subunit A
VAVAIVLNCDAEKIPPDLETLVRTGLEAGAALSGTVQTENIGFEKIICNVTANPNIRYLILGGPESEGHRTGEALKALFQNGVDDKKRIMGTSSPHPVLFNIGEAMIECFLDQVTLIDLQFEGDPETIKQGVWSCYQERAVDFRGYSLYDPGAYPAPPLSGKITWRVMQPWAEPPNEGEREALARALKMIERLRERSKRKSE